MLNQQSGGVNIGILTSKDVGGGVTRIVDNDYGFNVDAIRIGRMGLLFIGGNSQGPINPNYFINLPENWHLSTANIVWGFANNKKDFLVNVTGEIDGIRITPIGFEWNDIKPFYVTLPVVFEKSSTEVTDA